jgi:hypothetical protein
MSLPRINIELITVAVDDSTDLNVEHLIFSWLRAKLKSEDLSVLCDNNVNLLYFNDNDKTLHDCHDMEQTNKCFCDYVYDYQHTNHNGHHSETLQNGNKGKPFVLCVSTVNLFEVVGLGYAIIKFNFLLKLFWRHITDNIHFFLK